MPIKAFTSTLMDSMQGVVGKFNAIVSTDSGGSLAVDDALVLISITSGIVLAVMNRSIDFNVAKKLTEAIKPLRTRHVAGADLGRTVGVSFPDSRIDISDEDRAVANQTYDRYRLCSDYLFHVEQALAETTKCPYTKQTINSIRTAFLRSLSFQNLTSEKNLDPATDFDVEYVLR